VVWRDSKCTAVYVGIHPNCRTCAPCHAVGTEKHHPVAPCFCLTNNNYSSYLTITIHNASSFTLAVDSRLFINRGQNRLLRHVALPFLVRPTRHRSSHPPLPKTKHTLWHCVYHSPPVSIRCILFIFLSVLLLDIGKSKVRIQCFNGQQLNGSGRSKSEPDRNEPTPQTHRSIGRNNLAGTINKSIVNFLVRGLIHERCTNSIKGRDSGRHAL